MGLGVRKRVDAWRGISNVNSRGYIYLYNGKSCVFKPLPFYFDY